MCRFWSAITDQEPEGPLPCSTVVKSAKLTDAVLGGRGPRAAWLHLPAGSEPGGLSSGLPEEGRRQMVWERGSGGRKRKSEEAAASHDSASASEVGRGSGG